MCVSPPSAASERARVSVRMQCRQAGSRDVPVLKLG